MDQHFQSPIFSTKHSTRLLKFGTKNILSRRWKEKTETLYLRHQWNHVRKLNEKGYENFYEKFRNRQQVKNGLRNFRDIQKVKNTLRNFRNKQQVKNSLRKFRNRQKVKNTLQNFRKEVDIHQKHKTKTKTTT